MKITAAAKKVLADWPVGNKDRRYLLLHDFKIFPLWPNSKKPKESGWTDPGKWHAFGPNDNVGIFCGHYLGTDALIASGRINDNPKVEPLALVVVDIDQKPGKDGESALAKWEAENGALPPTREHRTPSGGRHIVYWCREAVKGGVNVLGLGLDIRSAGGFIVAPGSKTETGAYTVLHDRPIAEAPAALIAACGKPRERTERPDEVQLTGYAAEHARTLAADYLADDAQAAVQGAGGDEGTYKVACRVRDFGVSQAECLELMAEHWNERCSPPWSMTELETKIRNAYTYATGDAGADNPAVVFEPVPAENKPDAPAREKGSRYTLVPAGELLDRPDTPWLIAGLMHAQGLGVIYGLPTTGKSFLALDIAFAIARGSPWAGRPVRRTGPVVYVGLEGEQKMRVEAYMEHHKLPRAQAAGVLTLQGAGLNLGDKAYADAVELTQAIKEAAPDVRAVFVDTLNQAMAGGDENSSADMGTVIAAAGEMARRLGCLVVLVHHAGKDGSRGPRGHSSLHGAADVELEIERNGDVRTVKATKVKDGEDGARWEFRLHPVGLGTTPEGDPRGSCVVMDLRPAQPQRRKLTPAQSGVLDALKTVADTRLTADADGLPRAASVSREEWRAAYFESQGATHADRATKEKTRQAFDRGLKALVDSKHVHATGNGFEVAE